MKRCKHCGLDKEHSEYYTQANTTDGLMVWCKACIKEYALKRNRKIRKEEPQIEKGYNHEYYLNHGAVEREPRNNCRKYLTCSTNMLR